MIRKLDSSLWFPDPRCANRDGIVAWGGDLSTERLIFAYECGIFPWYNEDDPILWWSPDPRCLLYPQDLKISKSLKKELKKTKFSLKIDTNFKSVIESCKNIKRGEDTGTWINDEITDSYCKLHDFGLAHSFETYLDNELVGGLYGVSLGGAFFGESMFSKVSGGSKFAFIHLVELAKKLNFDFIDAQIKTQYLISFGAVAIKRDEFLDELEETLKKPTFSGSWKNFEIDLSLSLINI